MAKRIRDRLVCVECPTPALYRWFRINLHGAATEAIGGFIVHNEARFATVLRNAEGREI